METINKVEKSLHFTGTQINYYFVCHRKLWLFSRGIQMEQESDVVFQGKLISEASYERRRKEIDIQGTIVLDGFDSDRGILYEVKKSSAVEDAHIWQTRYYLYFLKKLGVDARGEIDYPLLRRKENVLLTESNIDELKKIFKNIDAIIKHPSAPEVKNKTFCRKCAYYEFCWE